MSRLGLQVPYMLAVDGDGDVWAGDGTTFECLTNGDVNRSLASLSEAHAPVSVYFSADAADDGHHDGHFAEAERLLCAEVLEEGDRFDQALRLTKAGVHALLIVGAGLRGLRRIP